MKIETIQKFAEDNNIASNGKSLHSYFFGGMTPLTMKRWNGREYVDQAASSPQFEAAVDRDGNVAWHNFDKHPNWKE